MWNIMEKLHIDPDTLLLNINQLEVWHHVLGFKVCLNESFLNPLRKDTKPSTKLIEAWYNPAIICMSDLGSGKDTFNGINVIKGWSFKFKVSYGVAFEAIKNKYLNTSKPLKTVPTNSDKAPPTVSEINLVFRDWGIVDVEYWKQYNISYKQLELLGCRPVLVVYINGTRKVCYELTYWLQCTDQKGIGKLYRPHLKGDDKWKGSNMRDNHYWKFLQFPNPSKAIITSSFKDGLVLYNNSKYDVYALASETITNLSDRLVEELGQYKEVIIFYDNDEAGNKFADIVRVLLQEHGIINISIATTKSRKFKDPSDLIANNPDKLKRIIDNL